MYLKNEMGPGEDYENASGVRWSLLKHLRDASPMHYQHALDSHRTDRETSDALRFGRAVHCMVFEPEWFAARFVTYAESKSVGEGARKKWQAFQEEHKHHTILSKDEWDRAHSIALAIAAHPIAHELLQVGRAEVPLRFDTPQGVQCKAKLDWLTRPIGIVDLKTALHIEERVFSTVAWKLGYFHQAAMYRRAVSFGTGVPVFDIPYHIIAVEPSEPFDIAVYQLDEEGLQVANDELTDLITYLADCRAKNRWPGRYECKQLLRAPKWATMDDDEVGGFEVVNAGS